MHNSKNQSYLPLALPSKDLSFLSRMERGRDCINHVFSTQKRVKKKVKKKTQVGGCSQESTMTLGQKCTFQGGHIVSCPSRGCKYITWGWLPLKGVKKFLLQHEF